MDIGFVICLILLCIIIHGYFTTAQRCFDVIHRTDLEAAIEQGNSKASVALDLVQNDKYRPTTVVARIFFSGLAAALSVLNFVLPLSEFLVTYIHSDIASYIIAILIILLAITFLISVFGEFVPERLSFIFAEKFSIAMAPMVRRFSRIFACIIAPARKLSRVFARIFGVKKDIEGPVVSEEEIKSMVDDAEELADDEKRMIQEIMDMGDTLVREIMTPRADMILVEDTENVRQTVSRMRGTGYSRIPVFHEDYDRIVGLVRFKDLIVPLMEDRFDESISDFMEDVMFIPTSKPILPLLSEMQSKRHQLAIVVDEYGGTAGLITVEDIVEEVVGEITDETDLEDRNLITLSETSWIAKGSLSCEDAEDLGWPVESSDDYDTIAGWFLYEANYVPQVGFTFDYEGYRFTIKSMRRRRISAIEVERLPEPEFVEDAQEETEEYTN